MSHSPCITLTSARPRVTSWLPLEPFWFRLVHVLGNTGYGLDPFDGVFVATIEPFGFRIRPILGRTGYDLDCWLRPWPRYVPLVKTLVPVTDNVGSNPRPCAGVLAPTWFQPWPCVDSFSSDLSPLCGRSDQPPKYKYELQLFRT